MTRTRIKFCGLTRAEDVAAAVELGVDHLGFVFVPASQRAVGPEQAKALVVGLPPSVTTVALLMDAPAEAVARVIEVFAPQVLQFHGAEPPDFCERWGLPYWKAVPMKGLPDTAALPALHPKAAALLLDGHAPGAMGGSGERFDWAQARDLGRPVWVAGGLSADNVGEAIRRAVPFGVDVSGGIESAPGVKDWGKMQRFVAAVRAADAARPPV